ncbi:MAG: CRISPR-associated protein [Bacteroidetes bacterium CG_4_10_14_3_um_filter_31_20]|nr:MAG: CRISPR-associated protein [Bacteroidetes bacterium CG_4_10_14_3_um_filter_31_20]
MKSFNSFEELSTDFQNLYDNLPNQDWYHGHISEHKEPEKLSTHIERVTKYVLKLVEVNDLDNVADKLINNILSNSPVIEHKFEVGNFIKQLFIQSIAFHDYGKINPNFQADRLKNRHFQVDSKIKIGTHHSELSTFVYLNHFFPVIESKETFSDDEKNYLHFISIFFANPILHHHSNYLDSKINFETEIVQNLWQFIELFSINISKGHSDWFFMRNNKGQNENIEVYKDRFYDYLKKDYFPLFALLKLNYSLLTAGDYLATNEYMAGIPIERYGLLSDDNLRNKITTKFTKSEKFQNGKDNYNKALYENFDFYRNLKFENLHERNPENLNFLRQKLTTEVVGNIRKHSDKKLFYIEAPTGSGKTNLSLAAAIELLENNAELNKIFYVFPFTTLVTQTFQAIKNTIGVTNMEIIQLHSKAGFHSKNNDGDYGADKLNYINNLFIHYPITLLTHIRFFDILKGNDKENNYILHRLSNSIVIIDEIQSYNPNLWDKVIYFIVNYAEYFNIRFIIMSATLPKIDNLFNDFQGKFVHLVENRDQYFLNANFKGRVNFSFELLDKFSQPNTGEERTKYLQNLKIFLTEKCQEYSKNNNDKIKCLIEFITKKSASAFYEILKNDKQFEEYEKFIISGDILEPRRKEIIDELKAPKSDKYVVVSTQVIEAGIDIDMDIGFKDRSIIDSDEQLAGRINRNAIKEQCTVYLFDFDKTFWIYGKDDRYKTMKELSDIEYKDILENKTFDILYNRVTLKRKNLINDNLNTACEYYDYFKKFNFAKINQEFRLIEQENESIFIPLLINSKYFEGNELSFLRELNIFPDLNGEINGEVVFDTYKKILKNVYSDFTLKQIDVKIISGIMSKYSFSIFKTQKELLSGYFDAGENCNYGYLYLLNWENVYSYYDGFVSKEIIEKDVIL